MATTRPNKIGATRKKLARMLEESMPGLKVDPAELNSQIPVYASPEWDCCSWYGRGLFNGIPFELASWRTMTDCVKNGNITIREDGEVI